MDDEERRSDLGFDAEESALENMRPNSDVFWRGARMQDPLFDKARDAARKVHLFGGESKKVNQDDKKKKSLGALKKNEEGASKDPNRNGFGGNKDTSLGEKEENVESDSSVDKFKNAVQGIKDLKSGKVQSGKGKLKKAGPIFAVLAALFCFGGAGFLGQMTMPFSLIAQFQEEFDSISVSQNMRTKSYLRIQMDNGNIKDCRKFHLFKADEFKPSRNMIKKLGSQGITFEDVDGVKVMKYKGQTIVADENLAGNGKINFEDAFNNDTDFRNAYTKGAKTWRGAVGAWFDSSMDKLLAKLGVKRGVWRNYRNGTDSEANSKAMHETIADEADVDNAKTHGHENTDGGEKTVVDGDDEVTVRDIQAGDEQEFDLSRQGTGVEADSNGKVRNTDGVKSKLSNIGEVTKAISSVAMGAVNVYCGVADFVAAVNGIVAAYQAVELMKTGSAIFEGIQKAQAGDSDATPIHDIAVALTKPVVDTYENVTSVDNNGDTQAVDTFVREESAMGANAIGATYSRTMVDTNDPSVASFNMNTTTKRLFSNLGTLPSILDKVQISATAFASCSAARLAAAAVGFTTDIVAIAGCIASWGVGCLIDAAYEEIGQTAASAALSIAIAAAVSFLVPHVAKVLTRKIAVDIAGPALGNGLVDFANMYMGHNHQYSGGGVASKKSYHSYLQKRDVVIAENAQFERDTRSPFDATSKYTFLGSLAAQMIPLASQATSLSGLIRGMGTMFGNAMLSLTPHSSAISSGIEVQQLAEATEKNCPDLASIGGIGDAFCNPYIITDMSTINEHPADIIDDISDDDIVAVDGKPQIQKDSQLAKYIVYCGQRQSPWGVADQNILGEVQLGSTNNSTADAIIGVIPVVGDFTDILGETSKLANMGWITGQSCVVNPPDDVDFVNQLYDKYAETAGDFTPAITWEDGKKYQRFIEDQRLTEVMYGEKSAVTEFLAEYYEEHPLDNSFEGVLARYSGYTKDQVAYTLNLLELGEFAKNYKPASLYPYPEEEPEEQKLEVMEDNGIVRILAVIPNIDIINTRKEAFIA